MFVLTMIMEDTQISLHREGVTNEASWKGIIGDGHTGKNQEVSWTDEQLAAILALAIAGPDFEKQMPDLNSSVAAHLYRIAEPAVKNLPKELRPIH